MPQTQVRVVGSGFTTFNYNGKPIAFCEAIEDSGQRAFSDVGQTLKARVKTLPGKQWRVRRAFDERIRSDFAAVGLKLAWDKG